jgi:transcriptional antiterminator NusG
MSGDVAIYACGDRVRVIDGPFSNFEAIVQRVDIEHNQLSVGVTLFGNSVPISAEPWQVEKHDPA